MENKKVDDLLQELRANEIKYGYYILAVNLACIGYIVDKTTKINVCQVDILLGLSLLCLTSSFILGLSFISKYNNVITLKINEKWIEDYSHPDFTKARSISRTVDNETLKDLFLKNISIWTTTISDKIECYRKWSVILFSTGAIFYFLWKLFSVLNIETIFTYPNR